MEEGCANCSWGYYTSSLIGVIRSQSIPLFNLSTLEISVEEEIAKLILDDSRTSDKNVSFGYSKLTLNPQEEFTVIVN